MLSPMSFQHFRKMKYNEILWGRPLKESFNCVNKIVKHGKYYSFEIILSFFHYVAIWLRKICIWIPIAETICLSKTVPLFRVGCSVSGQYGIGSIPVNNLSFTINTTSTADPWWPVRGAAQKMHNWLSIVDGLMFVESEAKDLLRTPSNKWACWIGILLQLCKPLKSTYTLEYVDYATHGRSGETETPPLFNCFRSKRGSIWFAGPPERKYFNFGQ